MIFKYFGHFYGVFCSFFLFINMLDEYLTVTASFNVLMLNKIKVS